MRDYFNSNGALGGQSRVESFAQKIDNHLKLGGRTGNGYGGEVASLESWDDPALATSMTTQLQNNRQMIQQLATQAGLNFEEAALESFDGGVVSTSLSDKNWILKHQKEVALGSAAMALEAATNPMEYIHNAQQSAAMFDQRHANTKFDFVADYTSGSRASELGILDQVASLEAFADQNLSAAMDASIAFNFLAPVQEPAMEALFKTVMMGQDQIAFFQTISIDRFYNGHKHLMKDPKTGLLTPKKQYFQKERLMDAVRRPSILRNEVLRVYPYYDETLANDPKIGTAYKEQFLPADVVKWPDGVLVEATVPTQPLAVGYDHNLLAISAHPDLMNGGIFDETDIIDAALGVESIIVDFGGQNNKADLVEFRIDHLERSNFVAAVQGQAFDMDLKFISDEFIIDEKLRSVEKLPLNKFNAMFKAGYYLRMRVELIGTANTESGYYKINTAQVSVSDVYKAEEVTGKHVKVDINTLDDDTRGQVKGYMDLINKTTKLNYFVPKAIRANRNLRSYGIMIDSDAYHAKFSIGLRSPLRIQHPIASDKAYPTTEKLLAALRTKQTADAIYEFFRYEETLKAYVNNEINKADRSRVPNMLGLSKWLVKPFYEENTVDIMKFVKSAETRNNIENIREGLVGILQESISRCLVESEWLISSTFVNNGQQMTPHFTIVTDNYLPLFLTVKGDLRLLGSNINHTIVTSLAEEFDGKIFAVPTVPNVSGYHVLNFGHTFWYPELVMKVSPHLQNGAIKETTMVFPRYQAVPQLPVMIRINVKGVKEFISSYNTYKVEQIPAATKDKQAATAPAAAPQGAGGAGVGTPP